jgi:hypothetical protein
MARATYYTFNLNGDIKLMTMEEASKYPELTDRIKQIIEAHKAKRMTKDGFEPGYQPNLGEYVGGRLEYNKKLKEKGLVEIGYDYIPKESCPNISPLQGEEMAKAVKEIVPELSDNEVEAIKTGEYFNESKVVTED